MGGGQVGGFRVHEWHSPQAGLLSTTWKGDRSRSLSVTLLVLESQMPDHKGLTGTDWIWGLGGESNRRG